MVPTMAGLAEVDSALASLPEALAEAALRNWVLHDVQWVPGRHCRLAWRVPAGDGADPTYQASVVQPGGWFSQDYRADPSLPGLLAATQASVVAPRLEQVVGYALTECHIQPVRYRPGSRCVLRYDVTGPAGARTFYAKVFTRREFPSTAASAIQVAESAAPTGLVVPVVAAWAELDTLLTAAVGGRSLSAFLSDSAVPTEDRLRGADRLGQLLGEFHRLDASSAPARGAADQLHELHQLGRCVATADARLGVRYAALLGALRTAAPPEVEHPVLAHGGFRAGQVVLGASGTLTLLDLDGVHRGDPVRDLATAAAQFVWQSARQPGQAELMQRAEEALLAGYQRDAAAVDHARLQWWRTTAILQVAGRRYRRLDTTDWELVPGLLDQARSPSPAPRSRGRLPVDSLMDVHRMTQVLAPLLAAVASAPTSVRVTSARELAVAPGRRRVVQYVVAGLDADGPTTLVAKVFEDPRRAELLHRHLQILSAGPFASGRWTVPQPLGYLPEHALVLFRASSGVPLSALPDGAAAVGGVLEAARWLGRLHPSGVHLPRVLDRSQEIQSTLQWAATLAAHDPELRRPALRLASGWATVGRSRAATRNVPIHKDFHPGHVLVDSQTCVVDLDEARLGDPAYDVAHFCTYLELGSNQADSLRTAFISEYTQLTGWVDDGAFASYSAYTWLKIAKQLASRAGPWRSAGADRGWTPGAALARGAEWLDR
jgi:aminoglycoside phosphotransferase (APT) family kinase protein